MIASDHHAADSSFSTPADSLFDFRTRQVIHAGETDKYQVTFYRFGVQRFRWVIL